MLYTKHIQHTLTGYLFAPGLYDTLKLNQGNKSYCITKKHIYGSILPFLDYDSN